MTCILSNVIYITTTTTTTTTTTNITSCVSLYSLVHLVFQGPALYRTLLTATLHCTLSQLVNRFLLTNSLT